MKVIETNGTFLGPATEGYGSPTDARPQLLCVLSRKHNTGIYTNDRKITRRYFNSLALR